MIHDISWLIRFKSGLISGTPCEDGEIDQISAPNKTGPINSSEVDTAYTTKNPLDSYVLSYVLFYQHVTRHPLLMI